MFGKFAKFFALIFHVKCHRFWLKIPSLYFESMDIHLEATFAHFCDIMLTFRKIFCNIFISNAFVFICSLFSYELKMI